MFQWFQDTIASLGEKLGRTAQPAADTLGVPLTDKDTQEMLGTASEPPYKTMTAGKRRHRTRRHRKGKKTSKRKH